MKRAITFYYDEETGELAKVDVSERFMAESALMQADVIGDINGYLEEVYDDSVKVAFSAEDNCLV